MSYRDAEEASNRLANGLLAAGIRAGQHVALLLENRPEVLWIHFALGKIGAVAVPVNNAAKGDLLAYYVNGREVARWEHPRVGDIASEIMFTMPVGGWDNEKLPVDSELPADFLIDYVRVWQRADLTPGGKP